MRKILLILVGTLVYMSLYAQFTTGTTGLLNMPTAEMQRDKTFMFGGGFFTTMLKHSKMDQAKQNMEQAKYDFRNFSKELDDVNMACNLNIDTGDFLSFADYFFDGFVVDWMVQDRINTARRQVDEAIRRTEYIVNQLQRM